MSKKKRPEKPQSVFSASRNAQKFDSEKPEAEPKHRLRDEKSEVSPLEALKKAQELSKQVSQRRDNEQVNSTATPTATTRTEPHSEPEMVAWEKPALPERPVFTKKVEPGVQKTFQEEETVSEPEILDNSNAPAKLETEELELAETSEGSEVSTKTEETNEGTAFYQKEEPEFVNYMPSPFALDSLKKVPRKYKNTLDKLFSAFMKDTADDDYDIQEFINKPTLEPLTIKKPEDNENDEDSLLSFKKLVPDTESETPDFDSLREEMIFNSSRRAKKSKMRRVSFPDFKRGASKPLPLISTRIQTKIQPLDAPARKLSAERYLNTYAIESPFKTSSKPNSRYYRRKISASLKRAILEDRPHPSEYNQPESYDVNAPLPELIPSDFTEEGLPAVFVEGGLSVEEALKARKKARRDDAGNIKKDLAAADFVDEAFGDLFSTSKELTINTSNLLNSFDADLLDWVSVLPPEKPNGEQVSEVLMNDQLVDEELSYDDYVDDNMADMKEPVAATQVDKMTYREMYLESLNPDLFMADFFDVRKKEPAEKVFVGEVVSESQENISEFVEGVPVEAAGEHKINKAWVNHNIAVAGGTALAVAVVASVITVLRGESWIIPLTVSAFTLIAASVFFTVRVAKYSPFLVNFADRTVTVKKKKVPFNDFVSGKGYAYSKSSLFKRKAFTLETVDGDKVSVLVEKGSFKVNEKDSQTVVDFITQTGLPYSGGNDFNAVEERTFDATKRNLTMTVSSSYMG